MISVNLCPVCESSYFQPLFSCKDFTVSHETFTVIKCLSCELLLTDPRPDNNALEKYYLSDNYISHSKKNNSILDLIYKITRFYTLRWKLSLIRKKASKKTKLSILDYGCGTGDFLKKCQEDQHTISGIEPSLKARTIAQENTNSEIQSDLKEIQNKFDVITLWHVLEHVPDLNKTLSNLTKVLQQNGTMFIAVPNHESQDAKHYNEHWAGYDVPRHLWHFSKTSLRNLIERNGLNITEIIPMKLDAFYVSLLSEKYVTGKLGPLSFIRALANGLKSNVKASKKMNYSSLIYIVRKK